MKKYLHGWGSPKNDDKIKDDNGDDDIDLNDDNDDDNIDDDNGDDGIREIFKK